MCKTFRFTRKKNFKDTFKFSSYFFIRNTDILCLKLSCRFERNFNLRINKDEKVNQKKKANKKNHKDIL